MYATHSLTCFFSRERHSSLTKLVTRACVRACMRVCVRASLYAFSNMFLAYRKSAPLWCYPPLKKNKKHSFLLRPPRTFWGVHSSIRYQVSMPSFSVLLVLSSMLSPIFPYLFSLWFVLVHPFPRSAFIQHVTLTFNFLLTRSLTEILLDWNYNGRHFEYLRRISPLTRTKPPPPHKTMVEIFPSTCLFPV